MKDYLLSPFPPSLLTKFCDPQDFFYQSEPSKESNQTWSLGESAEHITFEADVPGVQPENIEVTFEADVLSVRAKRDPTNGGKPFTRSRNFEYRVKLPSKIEASSEPKATCKNGVVSIVFAKAASAPNARKIAVHATG